MEIDELDDEINSNYWQAQKYKNAKHEPSKYPSSLDLKTCHMKWIKSIMKTNSGY